MTLLWRGRTFVARAGQDEKGAKRKTAETLLVPPRIWPYLFNNIQIPPQPLHALPAEEEDSLIDMTQDRALRTQTQYSVRSGNVQ